MPYRHVARRWCSDNIDLVVVDLARDLGSQGPFDVLLHKMTDVLVQQRHADTAAKAKIDNMQCYLAKHPETIMVPGSLSAAQLLCSRESTYRKVYEACASGLTESVTPPSSGATGVPRHAKIGVAPYVCVTPGPLQKPEPGNKRSLEPTQDALKKMAKSVSDAQLKYPLICKPVVAHGKASAHLMSIIFDEQGLADVLEPSVLQQYIPHGAVVFKVFVLGDTHGVSRRPSIRDLRGGWTGGPRYRIATPPRRIDSSLVPFLPAAWCILNHPLIYYPPSRPPTHCYFPCVCSARRLVYPNPCDVHLSSPSFLGRPARKGDGVLR